MSATDQRQPLSDESSGASWGEVIREYTLKSGVRWRNGRPNYGKVNKTYFEGRSNKLTPGSNEELVSKIVKNWEVDCQHVDALDWRTMDPKAFKASVNGGPQISAQFTADVGHANMLLQNLTRGYSMAQHTAESSVDSFSNAFPEGFAWEVLEVYSGPPKVNFKWRHFGRFTGYFVDSRYWRHEGDGRLVEVFGHCIVTLNEQHKISEIEVYYNPPDVIEPLLSGRGSKVEKKPAFGKLLSCCGVQKQVAFDTISLENPDQIADTTMADTPVWVPIEQCKAKVLDEFPAFLEHIEKDDSIRLCGEIKMINQVVKM